jgi:hypothetical protein
MKNVSKNMIKTTVKVSILLGLTLAPFVQADEFQVIEDSTFSHFRSGPTGSDHFSDFRKLDSDILWKCFEPSSGELVLSVARTTPLERDEFEIRFETELGQLSILHQEIGANGSVNAELEKSPLTCISL